MRVSILVATLVFLGTFALFSPARAATEVVHQEVWIADSAVIDGRVGWETCSYGDISVYMIKSVFPNGATRWDIHLDNLAFDVAADATFVDVSGSSPTMPGAGNMAFDCLDGSLVDYAGNGEDTISVTTLSTSSDGCSEGFPNLGFALWGSNVVTGDGASFSVTNWYGSVQCQAFDIAVPDSESGNIPAQSLSASTSSISTPGIPALSTPDIDECLAENTVCLIEPPIGLTPAIPPMPLSFLPPVAAGISTSDLAFAAGPGASVLPSLDVGPLHLCDPPPSSVCQSGIVALSGSATVSVTAESQTESQTITLP